MLGPIRVTRQARSAQRPARIVVPRVTILALLVLGDAMESGQFRYVVTSRAGGRRRDSVRAVGAVTVGATARDLAVHRGGLRDVTCRARRFLHAAVLVVAVRARLMTGRRGSLLGGVTILALRRKAAAVRLMAPNALGVALRGDREHRGVTRRARNLDLGGLMWKALMTPLARKVSRIRGCQRDLWRVASLAEGLAGVFRQVERELVRNVARRARLAAVKRVVGRRDLVATAARTRDLRGRCGRRVWIVAADAGFVRLRMIRMHLLVTGNADRIAHGLDVVRRVATLAARVLGHERRGEHAHALVTGLTRDDARLRKIVRTVAPDAVGMASGEEGRRWNDGLMARVTGDAGADRLRCRRVLMRVTRGADLAGRLPRLGVHRLDAFVA